MGASLTISLMAGSAILLIEHRRWVAVIAIMCFGLRQNNFRGVLQRGINICVTLCLNCADHNYDCAR